jgi:uncharacterized protein
VKRKSLLDSYAVLAWIQDEPGAQIIEDLFYHAQENREQILINIINLGEVYYRCARLKDLAFAKDILEKIRLLPLKICQCTDDLVMKAAEIKSEYPIAYADAFAVATAMDENARILTGDPDFRKVKHLVEVHWLK